MPAGGVFGLLGRNGAGKSTFVRMLLGLIRPTSGEARVFGRPAGDRGVRRLIGFLPENFRYPEWATGLEVLAHHAVLAGLPRERTSGRIATSLDQVGLGGDARRPVRAYSKGMQQRLGLASALLADPPLLLLDEPTSALDPVGRREVRGLLRDLAAHGRTVLLNSHLLAEVETLCGRVAILRAGRLVAQGTLEELLARSRRAELVLGADEGAEAALRALADAGLAPSADAAAAGRLRVRVHLPDPEHAPSAAAAAVRAGARLYAFSAQAASLEDVFIDLVADGPEGTGTAATTDAPRAPEGRR